MNKYNFMSTHSLLPFSQTIFSSLQKKEHVHKNYKNIYIYIYILLKQTSSFELRYDGHSLQCQCHQRKNHQCWELVD